MRDMEAAVAKQSSHDLTRRRHRGQTLFAHSAFSRRPESSGCRHGRARRSPAAASCPSIDRRQVCHQRLATLALMKHLGRTGLFYIGDEETDETVFSLGKIVTMGVRVGRVDGSRAGFYLHGQAEVEGLLRLLVQWMGGRPPSEVARGPTES